nr:MAG TPA: hypothetical protein [Caudoviricetes sp.]
MVDGGGIGKRLYLRTDSGRVQYRTEGADRNAVHVWCKSTPI